MEIAIDTGGTYTDCLGRRRDGQLVHCKVPSTPGDPSQAFLQGIETLVQLAEGEAPQRVVHGTTIATNALLQGSPSDAILILDRNFEDLLLLARQQRPDLYALHPVVPPPAIARERTLGFSGRMYVDGASDSPDDGAIEKLIESIIGLKPVSAIGICFLHADRHPSREQDLARLLAAAFPDVPVTCSHELAPVPGEYERATTTACNARLIESASPYLERLEAKVQARYPGAILQVVASNGDALPVRAAAESPVRLVLSGPAGGAQLGNQLRQLTGKPMITLDMGGTSTDCAAIIDTPAASIEGQIAHFPLRVPMLDIETIGAGGGSILWVDSGNALQVGPESAGADPGPACYGKGDQPTLTDAHVALGHLPKTHELAGRLELDAERAETAIASLTAKLELEMSVEEIARGAIEIAEEKMARAVRAISAGKGIDPSDCLLAALGGAGGLHAAGVARRLGIREVIVPPHPGLGSAWGLAQAAPVVRRRKSVLLRWPLGAEFVEAYLQMVAEAQVEWAALGIAASPVVMTTAHCRYAGQEATLPLPIDAGADVPADFAALHTRHFGFAPDNIPIEITAIEVAMSEPRSAWPLQDHSVARVPAESPVMPRGALANDRTYEGPLIITEDTSTTLVPDGYSVQVDQLGCLRIAIPPEAHDTETAAAIRIPVAANLLESITEEMGAQLERSAMSSNIKDRRDFSTALFDAKGRVVAQGAHIPVHLGSMQTAVQAAMVHCDMLPGQTVVANSPYHGGTHLPDITLISCVDLGTDRGQAFVACRAHHADIGGSVPGSMPLSPRLEDEGLLIEPQVFAPGDTIDESVLSWIAEASRQPEERRGDLLAQFQANQRGIARLKALVETKPVGWYQQTCDELIDYAAQIFHTRMSSWVGKGGRGSALLNSRPRAKPMYVAINAWIDTANPSQLVLDLSASSGADKGPFNAPIAVVHAAVAFVLRCFAPREMPSSLDLNDVTKLVVSEGSLIHAQHPSPTSAGNVETSQVIVAALFDAFEAMVDVQVPHFSQCTMNNLIVGGMDTRFEPATSFAYYETLAGGAGALEDAQGADAIHTHMTNSRNTPIEILESRFPIRIPEYSIRRHSGGNSLNTDPARGGHGIVRKYQFLTDVECTFIANWIAWGHLRMSVDINSQYIPNWKMWNAELAPRYGEARIDGPDGPIGVDDRWSGKIQRGSTLTIKTPGGWAWDRDKATGASPWRA